ncbi:MAG: hypothetical protein ACRDBO_03350 [Lachnospiraceae bacterium]
MINLLDSLRPNLGGLAAGTIVIVFISLGWLAFNNVRFKMKKMEFSSSQGLLDGNSQKMFLKNLTEIYKTLNMKTIMSTVTENLYYSIEAGLSILAKIGLRKEITIIPMISPQKEKQQQLPFVVEDGKNNMLASGLHCSYVEKYIDNATGKVLYKKEIPNAMYVVELIKSDSHDLENEYFCSSCGASMKINGDFFDCSHCGSHYNTESYSWSASDVMVQNKKKDNLTSNVIIGLIITYIVVNILGMNFPYSILGSISIGLDLLFVLSSILIALVANYKLRFVRQISGSDENFSRFGFKKRVVYLLKKFYLAKDFQNSLIQPFMVPELYKKFEANNKYDEYYVLDFDVLALEIKKYYVENGRQVADLSIKAEIVSMNHKKKLLKKKQKIRLSVCRDEKTFTKAYDKINKMTCENCGAPINLTKDGKCKYCGNLFDLTKFDWIISEI